MTFYQNHSSYSKLPVPSCETAQIRSEDIVMNSDDVRGQKILHLYGIDPGSSKPWVGYCASMLLDKKNFTDKPHRNSWELHQLGQLVEDIKTKCGNESAVLISLDVPIVKPDSFRPSFTGAGSDRYPFDVSPFTTRPCEAALRKKPAIVNRNLRHHLLIEGIAKLCKWKPEWKSPGNLPFIGLPQCEGVSVKIFSEAPHQTITSIFLQSLREAMGAARMILHPPALSEIQSSRVYVLESHPAVSLGFWVIDDAFGTALQSLPRYKGNQESESEGTENPRNDATVTDSLAKIIAAVCNLSEERYDLKLNELPCNDDELDAFVGFLNLMDIIKEKGDWFGTIETGYFLTPRLSLLNGECFSELWRETQ